MKMWIPASAVLALTCFLGCGAKENSPAPVAASEPASQPNPANPIEPAVTVIAQTEQPVTSQRKPAEMRDGPVVEGDQFAKGKEWTGRRVEVTARRENPREFKLVVTQRSGEHLQGVFHFPQLEGGGPIPTYAVEGSAPPSGDGEVRFSTLELHKHKQIFVEGELKDGEMWLIYNGKMASAGEVYGVGALKPKGEAKPRPTGRPRPSERTSAPGTRQAELDKLRNSEHYTAAKELAKNAIGSLPAKKLVWSKEAANMTAIELAKALREKFPRTLDERTSFSIYNARLQALKEENMTPEERAAKQELSLFLFSVIFPKGVASDQPTEEEAWAQQESNRFMNAKSYYESQKKAAERAAKVNEK